MPLVSHNLKHLSSRLNEFKNPLHSQNHEILLVLINHHHTGLAFIGSLSLMIPHLSDYMKCHCQLLNLETLYCKPKPSEATTQQKIYCTVFTLFEINLYNDLITIKQRLSEYCYVFIYTYLSFSGYCLTCFGLAL